MSQIEYDHLNSLNGLNESWVKYKEEQQNEILVAASEYEYIQTETSIN